MKKFFFGSNRRDFFIRSLTYFAIIAFATQFGVLPDFLHFFFDGIGSSIKAFFYLIVEVSSQEQLKFM